MITVDNDNTIMPDSTKLRIVSVSPYNGVIDKDFLFYCLSQVNSQVCYSLTERL